MARYIDVTGLWDHQALPAIRRIGAAEIGAALRQGWRDFMTIPTQLLFLGIIYPIIGIVAAVAASGTDLLPLLYPLVAGLALMGPVVAVGVYELSRRREQHRSTRLVDALQVVRSPALGSIIELGIGLLAIFVAWLYAASALYQLFLGDAGPLSLGQLLSLIFTTSQGWGLLIVGNLVGLAFAALVITITIVSVPLMLDRNPGLRVAVATSVKAARTNPGAVALWGVVVVAILAIASIPIFVGLAVAMPVLGHATWHLYRRMVV